MTPIVAPNLETSMVPYKSTIEEVKPPTLFNTTANYSAPPPLPQNIAESIAKESIRSEPAPTTESKCEDNIIVDIQSNNYRRAIDEMVEFLRPNIPKGTETTTTTIRNFTEKIEKQFKSIVLGSKIIEYIILPIKGDDGNFTKFSPICRGTHQINLKFIPGNANKASDIDVLPVTQVGGAEPILFSFRVSIAETTAIVAKSSKKGSGRKQRTLKRNRK